MGTPDPNSSWLSDADLADVRRRIPILYVEAVPVRVDGMGVVTSVGGRRGRRHRRPGQASDSIRLARSARMVGNSRLMSWPLTTLGAIRTSIMVATRLAVLESEAADDLRTRK